MKRYNGSGSIYKRKNRRKCWTVVANLNGEKIYLGSFEIKKDAIETLDNFNWNKKGNDGKTFIEVYNLWSDRHYRNISEATRSNYTAILPRLESIFNVPVASIKLSTLQEVIDLNQDGNKSVSNKIKSLMLQVLDYALVNEFTTINYTRFLKIKTAQKVEKVIFSDDDIKTLKNTDDEYSKMILIYIYTGFRMRELLDLKKTNVDIVNWFIIGGNKTDKGKGRTVPIPEGIRHLILHFYNKNNVYLFEYQSKPFTSNKYRIYIFDVAVKGLTKGLTPHSTRHTYATLLARAGVDTKTIQELVGHTDYQTTANIYTHKNIDDKIKAVDKL